MYTSLRVQINILFAENKMLLTIMYSVCQYLIKNYYSCECVIYCVIFLSLLLYRQLWNITQFGSVNLIINIKYLN